MLTKFKINRLFWVLIIHISTVPVWAAPHGLEVEKAEAIIERLMANTGIPGAAITIGLGGHEVWSNGYGFADLEHNIPLTPNTPMRVGSLSKSMTATALMKAREQGGIDLDADIRKYLPSFPIKKHAITLRQLGGHLGGVRHYKTDSEKYVFTHFDTVRDSLALFEDEPLAFAPGSEFHYSSYGYNLLSAVAASAFNQSFPDFMAAYLWHPLDMDRTVQDDVNQLVTGRARQYAKDDIGAIINARYTDNSYKFAGGGMLSTSRDLGKFGDALVEGSFLDVESTKLLFSSQRTTDGATTGYGFGWFVDMPKFLTERQDKIPPALYSHLMGLFHDRQLVWHSGTSSGAAAMLLLSPETQVTVAITANLEGIGPQVIAAAMEIEAVFSAVRSQ